MQQTITQLPEIKLVGITARTTNPAEMNPETAKIGATIAKFFQGGYPAKIMNKENPDVTYAVYTEYAPNFDVSKDEYTYFIGQQVSSFEQVEEGLTTLTIPAQMYAKFTSEPGQMPKVCIDMWYKIWAMNEEALGGQRTFVADFEVYDSRAMDPANTVLDIYIGIKDQESA